MSAAEDLLIATPDGRIIGCRVRGERSSRPLLYLHGMPGSRLEADMTLPDGLLAEHGFFLVSVDRPGYGLSDPRPVEDATLGSTDLIAVCDHLGIERIALVAMSGGCLHALAVAATHPSRVERVVLVSMGGPLDDDAYLVGMTPSTLEDVRRLRAGKTEEVAESWEGADEPLRLDPVAEFTEMIADFSAAEREWFADPAVSAAFAAEARESVRQGTTGWWRDWLVMNLPWTFDCAAVRMPVRAFHGERDTWATLANAKRVVGQLPDATLHVYPGLHHFGPWTRSDDLIAAAAER
jgi:pimeloyl-ACP methyl ester carboxylesterase